MWIPILKKLHFCQKIARGSEIEKPVTMCQYCSDYKQKPEHFQWQNFGLLPTDFLFVYSVRICLQYVILALDTLGNSKNCFDQSTSEDFMKCCIK